jgi:RNA-directed DNA polymerase
MAEDDKGVRYTHSTLRRESRPVYGVTQPIKETRTGHEGLENTMQTSLWGIANKAAQDKSYRFRNLYGLLTASALLWCWEFINKRAAAGVDRESAEQYEQNLTANVINLAASVKGGWYRAKLVLRKYIPKLNGKLRPLGIPAIADKLLQLAVAKILEAIYEQDFLQCSYGYRPGTGAHKAIKDLSAVLRSGRCQYVVEADIKGFFDNIDHNKLLNMLMVRIDDKPLLKLIRRWLKAGILDTDGQVLHPVTGTPQGGIISPILANVYLHYVLDVWFDEVVKAHCKGSAYLCRYADDFVCVFELESDARRFYKVLPKRLAKFGLEVAADKTKILQFDRKSKQRFEFLGFEFYRGKGRQGYKVLQRRTSRKKYKAALVNFAAWCKTHCHLPKPVLFAKLNQKLRGYWQYYGIRGNYKSLHDFFHHIRKILYKWLNRRSQKRSYNIAGFRALLEDFRLIKPRICHNF